MKKTFSISDTNAKRLEEIAKKDKVTQSSLVDTALTIYLLMYYGAPEQAVLINKQVQEAQKDQVDIFDLLNAKK